jgi:hypothetical protein
MIPTMSVRIPAMEDYLDHIGRMYILTTAGANNANPYYQVSWALYPDIAMDLIIPWLAKFLQVEIAGKLFFIASQLLIISGAVVLELSIKRRHEFAIFFSLMALYSMPFSLGLVNFEFGIGVGLWGIALWILLSRAANLSTRFIVHATFSIVLFLSHFFSLGIYGLTLGLFELHRLFESKFDTRRALLIGFELASPVIVMLLFMLWTGATIGDGNNEWWFSWKPVWFALFLNGYSVTLAAGSAAALAILLFFGAIRRHLSLSTTGKWIALGFLLVFIAMPFKLAGSRMADIRMISAAFLVLPAFVTVSSQSKSFRYFAAILFVIIILLNGSFTGYVWASYQNDYEAMKTSFSLLRRQSFILVANGPARDDSSDFLTDVPMWRAPTLAVYYAKAFVSSLYTIPGTHAVRVRPQWKQLAVDSRTETYAPPSIASLKAIAEGNNGTGAPQYIRNWQNDFDYVYVLGPRTGNALPNLLVELFTDRRFTLYRIRKEDSSK